MDNNQSNGNVMAKAKRIVQVYQKRLKRRDKEIKALEERLEAANKQLLNMSTALQQFHTDQQVGPDEIKIVIEDEIIEGKLSKRYYA